MKWIRDLFLLFLVIFGVAWYQAKDLPKGQIRSLEGIDLQGEILSLDAFQGEPVLVHFWATWCPICSLEEGSIQSISEDHNVLSVALSSGESDEIRHYMTNNGLDFPVIVDDLGELSESWGVSGVPATFVVDGSGRIKNASVGYTTELGMRARLWWYSRADN